MNLIAARYLLAREEEEGSEEEPEKDDGEIEVAAVAEDEV